MRFARVVFTFLLATTPLALCSCRAPERRPELPFTVLLTVNDRGPVDYETHDAGERPSGERLLEALRAEVERTGLFTRVVADHDSSHYDLMLQVEIDREFGAGKIKHPVWLWSTPLWIFAGHASWFVTDRYYDENVGVKISVESLTPGEAPIFFHHMISGTETNMWQRSRGWDWILNILVPPYFIEGQSDLIKANLLRTSFKNFGRHDLIVDELPWKHFESQACYLFHFPEEREILIPAKYKVAELFFSWRQAGDGAPPGRKSIGAAALADLVVDDGDDAREKLPEPFNTSNDWLYRIRLDRDVGDTPGEIEVRTVFDREEQETITSFTIYQPSDEELAELRS